MSDKIININSLRYYNEKINDKLTTIEDDIKNIFEKIYPVGSIYISANDVNPNILFDVGEWEQIKDTFLLAAGDVYGGGTTGGETEHTLAYSELPELNGVIVMHQAAVGTNIAGVGGCFTGDSIVQGKYRQGGTLLDANTTSIGKVQFTNGGENKAHNNMPPYLSVYVWKRIK